jgi:hypothetical protein
MRAYLLRTAEEIWETLVAEFSHLWRTERTGILYEASLFEDQGDMLGAEQALHGMIAQIWIDMLGFAGIETHRRILGLAHNADFETIEERCLARALRSQGPEIRPPSGGQSQPHPWHGGNRRFGRAAGKGDCPMKVGNEHYRTIWLNKDGRSVDIIDQRWLPHEFRVVTLRSVEDVAVAIRDMWVRGAPLIGVTAAYGVAIAMNEDPSDAASRKDLA